MTRAHAEAEKNINTAAADKKGCEIMLEYDEYKLQLQGVEKNITDLRDSL